VTTPTGDPEVIDVPAEHRFVVRENGASAELVYQVADGELVLVHTGVPDELGGRGIGTHLVKAAIEKAGREHLTIVPYCPFARQWLRDHPDAAGSTPIDWQPARGLPPR
jgi:predicted GNAT family acetyltransferase